MYIKKMFTEAIKCKDGILHNLSYHQDRMNRTTRSFYNALIDLSVLQNMIPREAHYGLYKCRVVYSDRIEKVEFTPYVFRKILKVGVLTDEQIDYSYKYADRTQLTGLLERSGCDDVIIIQKGLVTDSFACNLVFKSESGLFTPASYLLPGTKRRYLIDNGIVQEKEIAKEDIGKYQTVYFVNAMIDPEDKITVDTASLVYL